MSFRGSEATVGICILNALIFAKCRQNILRNGLPRRADALLAMTGFLSICYPGGGFRSRGGIVLLVPIRIGFQPLVQLTLKLCLDFVAAGTLEGLQHLVITAFVHGKFIARFFCLKESGEIQFHFFL